METPLDSATSWFLESLNYASGVLEVRVAEGILSSHFEPLIIGAVNLGPAQSVDVTASSRHYLLQFQQVLAYEVVLESYARPDKHGEASRHRLRTYARSEYLDFIASHTSILALAAEPYQHFALVLADEIINVIAAQAPEVLAQPVGGV